MGLSTPRHVTAMGNITCITRALLGLSLEPLISRCKTKTPTSKLHPLVVMVSYYYAFKPIDLCISVYITSRKSK